MPFAVPQQQQQQARPDDMHRQMAARPNPMADMQPRQSYAPQPQYSTRPTPAPPRQGDPWATSHRGYGQPQPPPPQPRPQMQQPSMMPRGYGQQPSYGRGQQMQPQRPPQPRGYGQPQYMSRPQPQPQYQYQPPPQRQQTAQGYRQPPTPQGGGRQQPAPQYSTRPTPAPQPHQPVEFNLNNQARPAQYGSQQAVYNPLGQSYGTPGPQGGGMYGDLWEELPSMQDRNARQPAPEPMPFWEADDTYNKRGGY